MKRFALPAVLLTLAGFALACGGEDEEQVEPEIVLIPVPEEAPEVEEEPEEEEVEEKTIEERMDALGDDGNRGGTLHNGSERKVNSTGTTSSGKKSTGGTTSSGGKKTTGSSGGKKTGGSSGGKKTGSGGKRK